MIIPSRPRSPVRLAFAFGCFIIAVLFASAPQARAHIGSPNVFYEGVAGPYPVHILIRAPEVIPGLAEITVRADADQVQHVTALPMKWDVGRAGAPPPDEATLVRGETNVFQTQLWFMEPGAQSVEVAITGKAGAGKVLVPVDAVATRVLRMPRGLGTALAVLGCLLTALLISIVGAATRESVIAPGEAVSPGRRRRSVAVMAGAFCFLALVVWGGRSWWQAEAMDYQNHRLRKTITASTDIVENAGQRALLVQADFPPGAAPLVPDHGKLMHLFLVREPDMDAFAHLHPVKRNRNTFQTWLPDLPAGDYALYGDITYETGLTETIAQRISITPNTAPTQSSGTPIRIPEPDPDDAWRTNAPDVSLAGKGVLSGGYVMTLASPEHITVDQPEREHRQNGGQSAGDFPLNKPTKLGFAVRDASGQPARFEPYLGMRGHLVLRKEDGSVFTHLHPGGTASMAAMQLAAYRAEGKLPLQAAFGKDEPLCKLPAGSPGEKQWVDGMEETQPGVISFPYAFPKAGRYRLWVQVKVQSKVLTGVFDVSVPERRGGL